MKEEVKEKDEDNHKKSNKIAKLKKRLRKVKNELKKFTKFPGYSGTRPEGRFDLPEWARHAELPSDIRGLQEGCSPGPLGHDDGRSQTSLDHAASGAAMRKEVRGVEVRDEIFTKGRTI